ncbi:chymotrypsin-1-like [Ptiloglossa arizonensis]|uniref:chymotrypsin-1-like n=1 Tax=Ptiloglossa arizonensis TaxID=3350558 RepID=UPI003F9F72CA
MNNAMGIFFRDIVKYLLSIPYLTHNKAISVINVDNISNVFCYLLSYIVLSVLSVRYIRSAFFVTDCINREYDQNQAAILIMYYIISNLLLFTVIGFVNAAPGNELVINRPTNITGSFHDIKLVNGVNSRKGQFPYTVSLRIRNQHFCGGSIINKNHILTAAHCVRAAGPEINHATVVTGTIYLDRDGESHPVAAMYYVANYPGNRDIGMIKLADNINFNRHQQPIPLATRRPPENEYAVVSGWGLTSTPPSNPSNTQQYLRVKMIDRNTCRRAFRDVTTEICTLNHGHEEGTCSGDSGGPLVYNGQLVGVVSRGVPCAKGFPDIFTSVYDNLQFINVEKET